uniref:Cytochrome P450 26A1-like n=1 Tax=Cyprinodon variegatus TaxID=28743 RepID=A0A3Q2E8R6_CYPVA
MSKLPGNAGASLLGDKSLDFYRDPVIFCQQLIEKYHSRVFLCRLLNRPTVFICSVEGMRELLCGTFTVRCFSVDITAFRQTAVFSFVEACLLRLSLNSLFSGTSLKSSADYISSGQPQCIYSVFKRLGTELVLGLFLNVRVEEQPEVFQEIMQLCTEHWHGLISAPVKVKVPLWTSGFAKALDARSKLMEIIKDKLENDKQGFVGSLASLPFPNSGSAAQHLLLFISALIPKALASLLTSFTLALGGPEILLEVQRLWPPFIGGRRIAEKDSTLSDFCVPKDYGAVYISYFIHRDPEVFQQPDSFLPERWSGRNAGQEHLLCSFGNGTRSCIGSNLTDIFLKEACRYLLKNYDWYLDPTSQDLDYKWLPVSRPTNLPSLSFTRLDQTISD